MAAARQENRRLGIRTRSSEGGFLEVSVTDTGAGIPEAAVQRIFDRYFSTQAHGIGLGLAICRTIVEDHQGRIWATRNPDLGMTFHFTLPTLGAPEA